MILHGIQARNFMSLRDCQIDKLDDHLNFLVGPNGSGKTTVFRALKAMRDTFRLERPVPFNQLCTRGVNPQELDLTLDVEFNTPWEQELITTFLCASLSRPDELQNILNSKLPQRIDLVSIEGYSAFSSWLLRMFRPEKLTFLFRGKLRLSYRSRSYESLRLYYTFTHEDLPITITIRPIDSVLVSGSEPENISGGFSPMNGLVDFFQGTPGHQDVANLLTRQSFPAENTFDPVACLRYLVEKRTMLGINGMNAQQIYLPAQQRFAELSGNLDVTNLSNRNFTFGYVLQLIFNHAFVFTNNLRIPFSDVALYTWEEATQSGINLDDERQIPLLLYRLKNGDLTERGRFQRIRKAFKILTSDGLDFDIQAQLNPQPPAFSFTIQIIDPEGEIPLDYHGAGIWEALVLSTILDESDVRIVLLDEPASNLHPGLQHRLLDVLRSVPGQVLVVTHSAYMLPTNVDDFCKVRRMQKTSAGTLVKGLNCSTETEPSQTENEIPLKPQKIEKELNRSSDVAGLLFADGVLLVEGETETGALDEWFPKTSLRDGKTFSDLNLSVHWVGGKTGFPFYLRFLTAFGVPWAAICDGDALPLNRDHNNQLWETLKTLHLIDDTPVTTSFEELKALAQKAGVYTANSTPDCTFENIPDIENFKKANKVLGAGKVQQGRYIATQTGCPKEVEEILRRILLRLNK